MVYLTGIGFIYLIAGENTILLPTNGQDDSMISFHPVTDRDLPRIKEMYDYYILNTTSTFHSIPLSIDELRSILFINNPKYPSFLITSGREPIGYCFLSRYKNRQAYDRTAEVSLYLNPEYTGKGIGAIAMAHIEEEAKKRGIKVLIGTLSGENTASMRLSEKMGFVKVAHLKHVGEKFGRVLDVVIYEKEI